MGFDFADPKTGFLLPQTDWDLFALEEPSSQFLASFNNLAADGYAANCNRSRRFAQYRAYWKQEYCVTEDGYSYLKSGWAFERLPLRPFIQSYADNKHSGGVPRYFEPVEADFTPILQHMMRRYDASPNKEFQIDINQYRVTADDDSEGVPVPEGKHKDGRPIVAVLVFRRDNVKGAELTLYPNDSDIPFARETVQPGYGTIFNDQSMYHDATAIKVEQPGIEGIRDYVAINFTPWDERRYGRKFEQDNLAPGQIIDEARVEPFGAFEIN